LEDPKAQRPIRLGGPLYPGPPRFRGLQELGGPKAWEPSVLGLIMVIKILYII
jgi:hypothetical protein